MSRVSPLLFCDEIIKSCIVIEMDFSQIPTIASATGNVPTQFLSTIAVLLVRLPSDHFEWALCRIGMSHCRHAIPRGASCLRLSLSCGLRRQTQTRRDNHNKEANNNNNPDNNNELWLVRRVHDGLMSYRGGQPGGRPDHWGRGQLPGVLQPEPRVRVVHLVQAPAPLLPPGLLRPSWGVRVLHQVKRKWW